VGAGLAAKGHGVAVADAGRLNDMEGLPMPDPIIETIFQLKVISGT